MRVLMSPAAARDQTNPFVDMLVDSLREHGVDVERFSWPAALFSRYDVLHVHWPEALLRSPRRVGRLIKPALVVGLLALHRLLGRHHVSTIHNRRPHESGASVESALIGRWLASCEARVYLSEAGLDAADDARGIVVPHGDYAPIVERHADEARHAAVAGRLLMFGQLREYKGIESLIAAFALMRDEGLSLRVLGKAGSATYERRLEELAQGVDGLTLQSDRALSDGELIAEISAAEAVVLPYPDIYNSGAAFLALTVGRPIIVTDSAPMRELAEQVGPAWVQIVSSPVATEELARARAVLRASSRPSRPAMPDRDWSSVARAYAEVYERVTARSERLTRA